MLLRVVRPLGARACAAMKWWVRNWTAERGGGARRTRRTFVKLCKSRACGLRTPCALDSKLGVRFPRTVGSNPALRQSPSKNNNSGEYGQAVAREAAPAAKPQPTRLRLFLAPTRMAMPGARTLALTRRASAAVTDRTPAPRATPGPGAPPGRSRHAAPRAHSRATAARPARGAWPRPRPAAGRLPRRG